MALMFDRIANNYAKNGYYPTDAVTLQRILNALSVGERPTCILDPCCGEGAALAEVKHHLQQGAKVSSYGVEFDPERAASARDLLDVAIRSDIEDMSIRARSFGLLFLNPPYGNILSDKAALSESSGKKRLEELFFDRCHPYLVSNGVLVLIVPYYALTKGLSSSISSNYSDVKAFMAPEKQFKQCVIFGRRKSPYENPKLCEQLEAIGRGELQPEELPEIWSHKQYETPEVTTVPHFKGVRLTADDILHELHRLGPSATVWPQFSKLFSSNAHAHRQPLRELRDWHLALALAAGQISGKVVSQTGRILIIKGDTYKDKIKKETYLQDQGLSGKIEHVISYVDVFKPSIRAIDFTPNSPTFGSIVTIQ